MSIVVQGIPSLYGGVSQQGAVNRAANQCEEAINCTFGPAKGAAKRPPLELVTELVTGENPDAFIHWAHTSKGDWFVVVIPGDGTLRVHKIEDGSVLSHSASTSTGNLDYLISDGPAYESFRAVSAENETYIVNREVTTSLLETTTGGTLAGTVQTLQDEALDEAPQGSIYKILGTDLGTFNGYYAKKDGDVWVEWTEPGVPYQINRGSMPHALAIVEDDVDPQGYQWEFNELEWVDRRVGNEESNESPSFIGRKITGITFISDRLSLMSGRGLSMSRTGDYTKFWRSTVTQVLDDDRIDITVDEDQITGIAWAANVSGMTTLIAKDRQFSLDGEPALTPGTVTLRPVTSYPASEKVKPVVSGPNVFFASNAGQYTHLREMFLQEDTVTLDAANASAHTFAYMPRDLRTMEVHTHYDHILMSSEHEPDAVYSYEYMWGGDEKIVSAWGRWQIAGNVKVMSLKAIDSYIYVVYQSTGEYDGLFLGRIDLQEDSWDDGFEHKVNVDQRTKQVGQYNEVDNRTVFSSMFPILEPLLWGEEPEEEEEEPVLLASQDPWVTGDALDTMVATLTGGDQIWGALVPDSHIPEGLAGGHKAAVYDSGGLIQYDHIFQVEDSGDGENSWVMLNSAFFPPPPGWESYDPNDLVILMENPAYGGDVTFPPPSDPGEPPGPGDPDPPSPPPEPPPGSDAAAQLEPPDWRDLVTPVIILGEGFENKGAMMEIEHMPEFIPINDFQFALAGDWTQGEVYFGLKYPQVFRFSEQFFQDGDLRALNVRLQLRSMQIHFTDTAFFRAVVKSRGREPQSMSIFPWYRHTYTSRTLNDEFFSLGKPEQTSGVYSIPVMGKASDTSIELINDSYMPSAFQSAEWRALISRRMIR